MRRDGRAVRTRVRRHARQPLVRRRAGLAHVLRPRPDRPAAVDRRVRRPVAPDRRRQGQDVPAHRAARHRRRGRPRGRHRDPRPHHRRDPIARRPRRDPRDRRLRQRVLPVDQRQGQQRDGELPRLQARRRVRQPLLHADPPDLHPGVRRLPVEADPDVGVAAERRPGLGAQEQGRLRQAPRRHPRRRARLLPRAQVPQLRQPVATRHRLARCQGAVRRRPRRRARRARRLPRLPRRHQARRRADHPREVRKPVRDVRADHRPCRPRSPGCSASARPTSRTTAPTGSARAR